MKMSLSQVQSLVSRSVGIPASELVQGFGPATEAEIPSILALRQPILTGVEYHSLWWDDPAYVRWRFFDARRMAEEGASSYMALRARDGALLGGVGIDRVEVYADGTRHPAVRLFDIMVDRDYDGRGLGVLINLLVLERHPIGLVVGDNPASKKLLERLFVALPELTCQKQLARSRAFLARHLPRARIARAVSPLVDLGLKAALRLSRPRPQRVRLHPVEQFDAQIDALSARVGQSGRTFVHRTGAYLNWRFAINPRASYRLYEARAEGRLCGYVVTRTRLSERDRSPEGVIVDWLLDDEGLAAHLLAAAAAELRHAGAEVTVAWSCRAEAGALRRLGFLPRREEDLPYYVYAEQSPLKSSLLDPGNWFVTAGDLDLD